MREESAYHHKDKALILEKARVALTRKDDLAFNNAWESYCYLTRGELPSSKSIVQFWSGVLGHQWLDHRSVPKGSARENLVRLLGLRYALTPYAGAQSLPVSEMPIMLQLACYMASGNRQAIENINPGEQEECITARVACLQMLDGEWGMASASFADCFRPSSILLYRVFNSCAAPLLAFALVCAVRHDAKSKRIDHWVDVLQRLLPENFPGAEGEQLTAFVHNVQVAADVLNKGKLPRYVPDISSSISCLPLAFCYRGLSAVLRAKIQGKRLAEAAVEALKRGPALLGYYAAVSLQSTEVELPPVTQGFADKLQQRGIVPLYADVPQLRSRDTLRPKVVRDAMEQGSEQRDEMLGWDLVLDKNTGTVSELRSILYSPKQGLWHSRDWDKCLSVARVGQDLAGLAIVRGSCGNDNALDWISVLAGHPKLRLVMAGRRTISISLQTERPRIHICREQNYIALTPESLDYRRLRKISAKEWAALQHSEALDKLRGLINAYGENGQLRFLSQDTGELYSLLAEWEKHFVFIGSLSEGNMFVEEDCRITASVSVLPTGGEIRLGVRVLPGSDKVFQPTEGPERVDVRTPAGIFLVQRDFNREQKCLEKVLALCPDLTLDQNNALISDDTLRILHCMSQLDAAEVDLLHNGNERLRCFTPASHLIELKTRRIGSEWFDIGGELVVDENLRLQLRELLAALEHRIGRYLPVRGGYICMPDTMEKQLVALQMLMSLKGRTPGISTAALPALAQAIGLENLPPDFRERLQHVADSAELPPPEGLQAVLRPYQLQGFRWLAERAAAGIGSCLADDMGLGKTLQLIALLLHTSMKGPSLVVAPLSLQNNWVRELARFAPGLQVLPFSANRIWHVPEAGEVVLVSYGQLSNNLRCFASVPWNVLALDEAQAIKNADSQRSKAVCSLPAFTRVCLTGTPVENSEMDLWSLMRFLNPLFFGTKASFRRRFLASRESLERLQHVVGTLFLRRTKEDVLTELPDLVEQVLPVELGEEERTIYEAVRRHAIEQLENTDNHISVLSELMRLRRACCHGCLVFDDYVGDSAKLNALIELLDKLRASNHKALVFSQFTDVLDLAESSLAKAGFRMARLDGSVSAKQRNVAIECFQSGGADVFLISLKAGGTGLNLTEADYVILLDPWWNPAVEAQAAARSHRMGQHRPVTLYRLIASHTVEEKMLQMHENKKELAETLLSGASLPLEEIRHLLDA